MRARACKMGPANQGAPARTRVWWGRRLGTPGASGCCGTACALVRCAWVCACACARARAKPPAASRLPQAVQPLDAEPPTTARSHRHRASDHRESREAAAPRSMVAEPPGCQHPLRYVTDGRARTASPSRRSSPPSAQPTIVHRLGRPACAAEVSSKAAATCSSGRGRSSRAPMPRPPPPIAHPFYRSVAAHCSAAIAQLLVEPSAPVDRRT